MIGLGAMLSLGTAVGPIVGATVFDATHSYRLALAVALPLCAGECAGLWLGPCPAPPRSTARRALDRQWV